MDMALDTVRKRQDEYLNNHLNALSMDEVRWQAVFKGFSPEMQTFLNNDYTLKQQVRGFLINEEFSINSKNSIAKSVESLMNYNSTNYPGINDGLPFEWWKNISFVENNHFFALPSINNAAIVEKPNAKEAALFLLFPKEAVIHIKNAKMAISDSQQLTASNTFNQTTMKSLINGKGDAFRHAYWNALDVTLIPEFIVKLFADAHEWNQSGLDVDMDFFNNYKGREIGRPYFLTFPSFDFIKSKILNAITNGTLKYLSPTTINGGIIPNSSQLIPTNQ